MTGVLVSPNVNVAYRRKELLTAISRYTIIRDCLGGEETVKAKKSTYLPIPNESDESDESSQRYDSYLKRAVFYNVTKRTLDGLCGQIFMRDPVVEVPNDLDIVVNDANGNGVGLTQLAKAAATLVVGLGRAGIFVDYPAVDGPVTKEQLATGDIRPTIRLYEPEQIINWRVITRGAKTVLSLIVLEEDQPELDDGFQITTKKQWRVLRLIGDVYTVELWKQDTEKGGYARINTYIPRNAAGATLRDIPFSFIGAANNDYTVDDAPMYDIAALNIAHYRNSADYEESSFLCGQPTPVFTGLSEDWVKNVLKGKVKLGARAAVSLPEGGDAKLLQATSNTMPFEAMQHKERQMVALGARIVEQKTVVRTATESGYDQATESSILASAAKNISAVLTWALNRCADYMGVQVGGEETKVEFSLNTDFDIATMSADDRRQLLAEWQGGLIAWEEARAGLRKAGVATLDDDKARTVIDDEFATIPGLQDTVTGGTTA